MVNGFCEEFDGDEEGGDVEAVNELAGLLEDVQEKLIMVDDQQEVAVADDVFDHQGGQMQQVFVLFLAVLLHYHVILASPGVGVHLGKVVVEGDSPGDHEIFEGLLVQEGTVDTVLEELLEAGEEVSLQLILIVQSED
eukprot:CAMPEP_0170547270 /NCGR_PEP_ID=MMETSP0211-20121228/5627_1 /TAXON_ID=311385 /ORGANISM="Pseudokeronopsis sp., Strain OXSARD2" /LENGTH=137 /DNA_ID=CAMNT_0010852177 /DNA_START=559 /DNA_END=969 /DNA_ORIENTATION=-